MFLITIALIWWYQKLKICCFKKISIGPLRELKSISKLTHSSMPMDCPTTVRMLDLLAEQWWTGILLYILKPFKILPNIQKSIFFYTECRIRYLIIGFDIWARGGGSQQLNDTLCHTIVGVDRIFKCRGGGKKGPIVEANIWKKHF